MNKTGKYIYGVIASSKTDSLAGLGAVHTVVYQDVAAVVSDSEIVDYTHLRKDALALFLLQHQKTIETVMKLGCTIIPMRLGTFAADEAEVWEILSRCHRLVQEIFPKIQDKFEIDVAVTWKDFPGTLKEIGSSPEITEMKKALLGKPQGVTVDDQMKVGLAVKEILDGKGRAAADCIQEALREICGGADTRPHALMDDRMVLNCAFLTDQTRQEEFYARIEELNKGFSEKLNFRCVGPLPAYSFYTLETRKMDFKELDWARQKLGLVCETATQNEIKKAYHRAAVSFHPDKNLDTPGMDREFDIVKRAHKILADYCLASAQSGQEDRVFFDEEKFKKSAILVKVGD